MRLLALGDRNPDFLTHREIDSTLKLLPADVDCRWVATDDPRARELAVGSSQSGELHPVLSAWLRAAAAGRPVRPGR